MGLSMFLLANTALWITCIGQSHPFILTPEGRIQYNHAMSIDSNASHVLFDRGLSILDSLSVPDKPKSETSIDYNTSSLKNEYGFYLYRKTGINQQIYGRVTADVTLIVKKDQVAIMLDHIYIVKYHKDRFAQFKPKTSRKYYLDEQVIKNKSIFDQYFAYIDEKSKNIVKNISYKLVNY